jgi:hypothetical protein
MWVRNLLFVGLCAAALVAVAAGLYPKPNRDRDLKSGSVPADTHDIDAIVKQVDEAFRRQWDAEQLVPASRAPDLAIARRLSLALLGTIPSLEEIRWLEALPVEQRVSRYLDQILADRRYADYTAERLARAYVGVIDGPFVLYRRRRFVSWLADELHQRRPYDQIVRQLITSNGLWTDKPATNFLTVTVEPDNGKGIDENKLAARVSRAMLGVRIDCAECHDHPFDRWKQDDFQGLAAFFGEAEQQFTGIRDVAGQEFQAQDRHTLESKTVEPRTPFLQNRLPQSGTRRERLAAWITDRENRRFARAAVNRFWAILCGRPLVEPVDDLRDDGAVPPALDLLAEDFAAHDYDVGRLIRVIAGTEVYWLDSRADPDRPGHEITPTHEAAWAAFPITRLRPEQVVGAVLQSASLETLDHESHILARTMRAIQQNDFIKAYGDAGEDELEDQGGTVPQRLVMMNGELIKERTKESLPFNAATRIALLAPNHERAVETAYLTVLTRRPTQEESRHFVTRLAEPGEGGAARLEDLCWTLLNSTEFCWNH